MLRGKPSYEKWTAEKDETEHLRSAAGHSALKTPARRFLCSNIGVRLAGLGKRNQKVIRFQKEPKQDTDASYQRS
ncbi:hypothetical protein NDU88_000670 [Pleurodeles waltl]|uniref:Uncharacterized protein n=1 Tax=Pleurodeles waltl TaxID=8319 RepID=A0AAV7Q4S9_PLEWA|nr:hypothetical protein NDU88_000670 [Pleurodeles waltl]